MVQLDRVSLERRQCSGPNPDPNPYTVANPHTDAAPTSNADPYP
jgi:hypothetical protein